MRLAKELIYYCLITLLALGTITAANAYEDPEITVFDSNIPGINPGDSLPVTKFLNVPAEQYVRLLTPDGEILDLVGPHQGAIESIISGYEKPLKWRLLDDLRTLIFRQGQTASAVGATRSITIGSPPPKYNPENVEIAGGKRVRLCLENNQTFSISRNYNPDGETQLWVRSKGQKGQEHEWPLSRDQFSVPAKLLASNPSRIKFSLGDRGDQTTVRLAFANPKNPGEQLRWFQKKGCEQQLASAVRYYREY